MLDLVCDAIATARARPGAYDIRIAKLGGHHMFLLSERATGRQKRLYIQSAEEAPVIAGRLAQAMAANKIVADTQDADNAASYEAPPAARRAPQTEVFLGVTGLEAVGVNTTPSGGVELDVAFRTGKLTTLLQGRAGGIGSALNLTSFASAGVGARFYQSDADAAPFAGAGFSLAYFNANQPQQVSGASGGFGTPGGAAGAGNPFKGSGMATYLEVGYAFMRSSRVGAAVILRADMPIFALNQVNVIPGLAGASQYVVPASLNVGLTFR
jgi:hypothetical protein